MSLPSFKKTAFELDFDGFGSRDVWVALLTFLYVDFLDTTGTLFSMATHLGNYIPGKTGLQQTNMTGCNWYILGATRTEPVGLQVS